MFRASVSEMRGVDYQERRKNGSLSLPVFQRPARAAFAAQGQAMVRNNLVVPANEPDGCASISECEALRPSLYGLGGFGISGHRRVTTSRPIQS
jgi:hypothetical protein